ncbi:unnamed protein product [Ixodes pacificus]
MRKNIAMVHSRKQVLTQTRVEGRPNLPSSPVSPMLMNPSQKAPPLEGRHASRSFPSPRHKNKTDSLVTSAFRRHVDEKEPNAKPGGTHKARTTPTTRVTTVCDPANPFPIRDPTARDSHSPTINNRLCTNLQQTNTVLPLRGRTVTNNGTTAEPPRHFTRSEHRVTLSSHSTTLSPMLHPSFLTLNDSLFKVNHTLFTSNCTP